MIPAPTISSIDHQLTINYGLISGFMRGLQPDPVITVSEWADTKRELPEIVAEPGRYKTSRTPYLKEIMDKLTVIDPAQKIIVMKGSQVGFTESGNNWLGYTIDIAPAPFLYVMPTDGLMKETSKTRIQTMISSTPALAIKSKPARSKDSGNTLLYKEFEGMFVNMVGANSPVGLSSKAVRNVYLDEIDRYPDNVGGEGSALDLAETRTATFGERKKIFITSTPTIKNTSAIESEFLKTGQRFFHVPCPHCGQYQVLVFAQLRYEKNKYKDVKYECAFCKKHFGERHKPSMLAKGQWVAKFPHLEDGITFGYHLSAMYSPYGWYSWAQMAKDYEASRGDVPKEIVFQNTKLGEVYEEMQGEKPDWEALYDRAHNEMHAYESNKPFAGVVFITAGVDVQSDRLEVQITGWMKGKRSQQIDYRVYAGNTDNEEVWQNLDGLVNETWIREDGLEIPLRLMAIDTGYNTHKVYEFCRKYPISKVVAVKGREQLDTYYSAPRAVQYTKAGKKINKGKVWPVGVSLIKSELYGFLKRSIDKETGEIPYGYCHFLKQEPNYFRGLTAEELTPVTNKKGFTQYVWVKKYERNEPLDTFVYARAAAAIVGVDRWTDDRWEKEWREGAKDVVVSSSFKVDGPQKAASGKVVGYKYALSTDGFYFSYRQDRNNPTLLRATLYRTGDNGVVEDISVSAGYGLPEKSHFDIINIFEAKAVDIARQKKSTAKKISFGKINWK